MSAARPARKLALDPAAVRRARTLARQAGRPIVRLAKTHTTVSVERAVLRLAGVRGADPDGIPWVNRLVDAVRAEVGLEHGVALPVWDTPAGTQEGLPALLPDAEGAVPARPACRRTVLAGETIFEE